MTGQFSGTRFAVFDTAIRHCGIAWSERGVFSVCLPDRGAEATGARLRARFPEAAETEPSTPVAYAISEIVALLRCEPRDLTGIPLDLDGVPEFHRRVYARVGQGLE
jgi:methylated-DNA-[protein]-cysteine S-methyltransferase